MVIVCKHTAFVMGNIKLYYVKIAKVNIMLIKFYFQRLRVDNSCTQKLCLCYRFKWVQVSVENYRNGVHVFSILLNINATQITEACS